MRLYVIRHADAVQADAMADEERPLTDVGREQSRRLGGALRRQGVPLDRLLTSPLLRAKQTCEGVVAGWGDGAPPVEECEYLAPGSRKKKLIRELLALGNDCIGVVGHNPDLSELIGWLIGQKEVNLSLEKAGAACIEFDGSPAKDVGVLVWLVTPAWCG